MLQGTVKFFNRKNGFGFIITDETGKEVFFHATGIINKQIIKENDRVSFDEQEGERGLTAVNVQKI